MKKSLNALFFAVLFILLSIQLPAQNAYISSFVKKTLFVVNTNTNQLIDSVSINSNANSTVVSPDGKRVYIGYNGDITNSNVITVINTMDNKVIGNVPINFGPPYGTTMDISPDSKKLYVPYKDTIFIINTESLKIDNKIYIGQFDFLNAVTASPDGLRLYAAGHISFLSNIYVLDAIADTVINTILVNNTSIFQMVVSPDNKILYAADQHSGNILMIDLLTNITTSLSTGSGSAYGLTLSPDGTKIYATTDLYSTVAVIDVIGKKLITAIPVKYTSTGISITPDGGKVYVVVEDSGSVAAINTLTNMIDTTINISGYPRSLGKFISGGNILPVTLINFIGFLHNQTVELQWQTATEINAFYFNIQRSTNGVYFNTISKIAAIGNSTVSHTYNYNDINVSGALNAKTVYYRLQFVDKDGTVSTSKVVVVILNERTVMMLLQPNPVKNILSVKTSNYSGNASFTINDMTGKTIIEQQKKIIADGSNIIINTSTLPSGSYFIQIRGKNLLVQQKFIKE